jgi:hypothetical protein
MMCKELA